MEQVDLRSCAISGFGGFQDLMGLNKFPQSLPTYMILYACESLKYTQIYIKLF